MGLLEGRLAVVTAGTAGIGRATARRFIAEGADVVVVSPFRTELDETVAALGPHAIAGPADASDPDDLDRLAAQLRQLGRPVDTLFVNAGRDVSATAVGPARNGSGDTTTRSAGPPTASRPTSSACRTCAAARV